MTALQPIRMSPIGTRDRHADATLLGASTTPRATFQQLPPPPQPPHFPEENGTATPTRDSFAAANGKRSLTESSTGLDVQRQTSQEEIMGLRRHDSLVSNNSSNTQEVDMADIGSDEGEDASDNDSNDESSERPSKKKKKGQRFFCTEYPPCSLSFTRSEHLARHIRKHTGERPFQCHCARRFSRLDNLRQHAQTVHVNEDIPGDSLAATGTRFQRQIRTDRVRPPGARSRASTGGSQGPHHRGHARNLSTSSIGSVASTTSTISTMSDFARENARPHSLNLSDRQSPRGGLTIDTFRASPQNALAGYHRSPSGASTPTSYVYTNTPSSPFGSTLGSPISISRNAGSWADRAVGRRLSVPSGINPFQTPSTVQGPSYMNPSTPSNSSQTSTNNSTLASPTSSNYSLARNDVAAEADWRRRTWHPTTYSNCNQQRPATSGLSYSQTPDAPRPAFAPQAYTAAGHTPRLPGFETFDQISQRPATPPRQAVSRQADMSGRPALFSSSSDRNIPHPRERRGRTSWDLSLHQNLTKLEIAGGTPPRESTKWSQSTNSETENPAPSSSQTLPNQPPRPTHASHPVPQESQQGLSEIDQFPQPSLAAPSIPPPVPPPRARRQGWYNGAALASQRSVPSRRRSPEDSSSSEGIRTPAATALEYQPTVVHAGGNAEAHATGSSAPSAVRSTGNEHASSADQYQKLPLESIYEAFPAPPQKNIYSAFPASPQGFLRPRQPAQKEDTSGLDVLVAAATSEGRNHLPVSQ